MSNEVTEVAQEPVAHFLGLDKTQFATVLTLSSVSSHFPEMVTQAENEKLFNALRESGDFNGLREALAWTSDQRDRLLRLQTIVSFAMKLVSQVQDGLIESGFAPVQTQSTQEK